MVNFNFKKLLAVITAAIIFCQQSKHTYY